MIVSVIYPKTNTSTFDMEYYTSKHLPLLQARWTHHGMTNARILHGTESLGGGAAYEVITLLEFPSRDAFITAAAAHAAEIMGDVPHFTNINPIVQFNEIVAG